VGAEPRFSSYFFAGIYADIFSGIVSSRCYISATPLRAGTRLWFSPEKMELEMSGSVTGGDVEFRGELVFAIYWRYRFAIPLSGPELFKFEWGNKSQFDIQNLH